LIQERVLFNHSSSEIGLLIYGADEKEGGNMILREVKRPDLDFLRSVG
jgi:hypothetical protein